MQLQKVQYPSHQRNKCTGHPPGKSSASIAEMMISWPSCHQPAMKMFIMAPEIPSVVNIHALTHSHIKSLVMEISEDVIERTLNTMLWVLEPYLEESILDQPHLLELAESYNEIAAMADKLCDLTFSLIEIH